jgi:acetylglutamate synthase
MTDFKKLVAITHHPGLYRHLSQRKNGIIVESLIDGKRMYAPPTMQVSLLADIAVYTDTEDLPLREVLLKIKNKQQGQPAINSKSPEADVRAFFEQVLPDYDRERFYLSHMKKVLDWYNLLQQNNMLDIEEPQADNPKDDIPNDTSNDTPNEAIGN